MKRIRIPVLCLLLGFGLGLAVPKHKIAKTVQPAAQLSQAVAHASVRCYDETGKELPENDPLGIR
jgi:hypothetical protein